MHENPKDVTSDAKDISFCFSNLNLTLFWLKHYGIFCFCNNVY